MRHQLLHTVVIYTSDLSHTKAVK